MADVWRHKLLTDEKEINAELEAMEKAPVAEGEETKLDGAKDELSQRLGDVQKKLVDMEAETGPARAALLLAGLGFSESDQKMATRSFSGGWRMRLALARALFVKPDVSCTSNKLTIASNVGRAFKHVGSERHCMARGLSSDLARNHSRCVGHTIV
jgi:hypothetical protein